MVPSLKRGPSLDSTRALRSRRAAPIRCNASWRFLERPQLDKASYYSGARKYCGLQPMRSKQGRLERARLHPRLSTAWMALACDPTASSMYREERAHPSDCGLQRISSRNKGPERPASRHTDSNAFSYKRGQQGRPLSAGCRAGVAAHWQVDRYQRTTRGTPVDDMLWP